jgi:hypothetical protein
MDRATLHAQLFASTGGLATHRHVFITTALEEVWRLNV